MPLMESVSASTDSVAFLLGPEGGWTDHERTAAQSAGWTAVSLGGHILRAETAGIAALSVVNAVLRR
jgi:16S rRNA (uracil1498-N3)-methyltransferase